MKSSQGKKKSSQGKGVLQRGKCLQLVSAVKDDNIFMFPIYRSTITVVVPFNIVLILIEDIMITHFVSNLSLY